MSTASPADDRNAPVPGGDQAPAAPGDPARVGEPVSGGQPVSIAPLSGRIVGGKWRVLGLLGRGGMGSVYEAQNTSIGKRVALKFIEGQPDHEAIARFQREAEAASAVDSAHMVRVFDTGLTDDDQPYLVMELLRGESLGARLRRLGRLSMREAMHVVGQVLRGLHRAHAAGVIHRDLKPDNVFLVDRDDDPLFVKILDFGISKVARQAQGAPGPGTITRQGTVLGTPFYMSPEQAQATADLDPRSDLFSVGVILYECLVGQAPWASLPSYEAVIVAVCSRDAPDVRASVPEVPAALAAVVRRGMSRDRERRYESASAMLEALRASSPDLLSARDLSSSAPSLQPVAPPSVWTPSEPLALAQTEVQPALHTPTPKLPLALAPPDSPRRWPLAVGATLLAFVGTAIALRQTPAPPAPIAVASTPPTTPEVTMRLVTDVPGARILVNGKPLTDGVLRGAALSSHDVRVEAPGHAPLELSVPLDGRPVLHVPLAPSAPASAAAEPSAAPAASTAAPVVSAPLATAVTPSLRPIVSALVASARPALSAIVAPAASVPKTDLRLKGTL